MVGSRIASLIRHVTLRFVGRGGPVALLGSLLPASGVALATDINIPAPATGGPPIVLFHPSPQPAPVKPTRSTNPNRPGSAALGRTAATKPPISQSPAAAKLGPPPTPRPALPLDTDLQPLARPSETPQPGDPGSAARQAALGQTAR